MADYPYNTAAWQRLRLAHLAIEPMCRGCRKMGKLAPANVVDHITAISEGGPAFPGHDGLASYCAPCHNRKTARGAEAGAARTSKPMRGCDADGNPLDPAHPWSGKSLRADRTGPLLDPQNQLVHENRVKGER
ncbi:HNH endonuclease [Novosphingobium sp. HII-3]|uniref:HNH endonuclease n=1 Tax=Novosphingobium sp. HII-3 TaxID=2075565 RepID=UPI000CDADD28